ARPGRGGDNDPDAHESRRQRDGREPADAGRGYRDDDPRSVPGYRDPGYRDDDPRGRYDDERWAADDDRRGQYRPAQDKGGDAAGASKLVRRVRAAGGATSDRARTGRLRHAGERRRVRRSRGGSPVDLRAAGTRVRPWPGSRT